MTTKIAILAAAVALALGSGLMSSDAEAINLSRPPGGGTPTNIPPTTTVPGNLPTPVGKPLDTPTPTVNIPPPVVIGQPKTTPMPGTFANLPSDMRSMTRLDAVTSVDRLLAAPIGPALSLPLQAVPNRLENVSAGNRIARIGGENDAKLEATELVERAKPLI